MFSLIKHLMGRTSSIRQRPQRFFDNRLTPEKLLSTVHATGRTLAIDWETKICTQIHCPSPQGQSHFENRSDHHIPYLPVWNGHRASLNRSLSSDQIHTIIITIQEIFIWYAHPILTSIFIILTLVELQFVTVLFISSWHALLLDHHKYLSSRGKEDRSHTAVWCNKQCHLHTSVSSCYRGA